MDSQTITNWLLALRSGKYKQGKYVLRNQWKDDFRIPKDRSSYEYCPLGLLCEISGFRPSSWYNSYPITNEQSESMNGQELVVKEYDGLSSKDQIEIGSMNDSGKSFIEIADWVEKNIKPK